MQFIFDHLIATLVAATLGLAMIAQQIQSRQAAMERQSVHQAKGQALAFGEWLEDDVVKLGSRFGRDRDRFEIETEVIDGRTFTRRFEYYYYDGSTSTDISTRVEVLYELAEDDSTRVVVTEGDTPADDVTMQVYDITRSARRGEYDTANEVWVGSEPVWDETPEYGSPHGLRHFLIQPRDSDSQVVADDDVEEADYVRLEFSVVPTLFPLHRARIIPENGLHWATTIEIRPF
ncbi:hypothetical protein [Rubrivirga sp.]|uniref:hypothetical protein n=1 Tax=Rubrivirga sp. TaxID=1885344 RepID=UPI003C75F679